ncbi:4Fe-4S binding protein [Shigella flexneri]
MFHIILRSRHDRFVVAEPLWCTGCQTCLAACSDVHRTRFTATPAPALRRRQQSLPLSCVITVRKPLACRCPVNAISQRDDAIRLNESLCIGCKLCAVVCPFGVLSASGSPP